MPELPEAERPGPFHRRFLVMDLVVVAVVAVLIVVLAVTSSGGRASPLSRQVAFTVNVRPPGRVIPAGFLGLSIEYPSVEAYAGNNPRALNPVLEQLIRNLTPGQPPVLRIGGDSADTTWWPLAGTARPPGVTYALGPQWVQVTRALTVALGAHLILGINLEAGSPGLAAEEANQLIDGIGSSSVRALELGNEPELYGTFAWYHLPDGRGVPGRPLNYDFTAFTSDFTNGASALPQVALAGPAFGGLSWASHLAEFLSAESQIGLVTVHRYPLQQCFSRPGSPRYPTIWNLLSAQASTGLADAFVPYAVIAHGRGLPLRIDELNTVSCGANTAVSQSFASALWAVDALFEMARAGVDGVNIHTFPGAGYSLFSFNQVNGQWRASVSPEYYGLLMFAQAAPPGSRLLAVSGVDAPSLKVWATSAPDRHLRVVLINKDLRRAHVVALRVPQAGGTAGSGRATLERLQAPSAAARAGVTLGGGSFGAQTGSGTLVGFSATTPASTAGGTYMISLPAASAALLTLPAAEAAIGSRRS